MANTETFTTSFVAGSLASSNVLRFRVERRLGHVAEVELDVYASDQLEPDDLLGLPAHFSFGRDAAEHDVHGVVMDVTLVATPDDAGERGCVHRIRVTSLL